MCTWSAYNERIVGEIMSYFTHFTFNANELIQIKFDI
jgi:hypothetical protein